MNYCDKYHISLVQWQNWDEWRFVKNLLFSEDKSQKFLGVQYVHAWRARGPIPHYIDITAQLIQFYEKYLFLDKNYIERAKSEEEMKHEGASIIIRFVNGIVDANQKGSVADSVTFIANKVGLHRMFVDIRHDGTHNDLPSWEILGLAVSNAIDYLSETYWKDQLEKLEKVKTRTNEFKLKETLKPFKNLFISNENSNKQTKKRNYNAILDEIFKPILNTTHSLRIQYINIQIINPLIDIINELEFNTKEQYELYYQTIFLFFQNLFEVFYYDMLKAIIKFYISKSNNNNFPKLDIVINHILSPSFINMINPKPNIPINQLITSLLQNYHKHIIIPVILNKVVDNWISKEDEDAKNDINQKIMELEKLTQKQPEINTIPNFEFSHLDSDTMKMFQQLNELKNKYPIHTTDVEERSNFVRPLNDDEYNIL